ncbi:hypothetical protein [Candidatus Nitronereus thalassa]|uniref:Uncharacterized protein n=1 Tax=Candidatus Nitronereus thalassa TaxID=3020898 RepID=A0ABU3K398_9BACT|nr:hypothetical protein [Candidatus Nitronereus thalassa]MDT7040866.1 hypothetical protein [Candidatus Nitronereus thalassa]
MKNTNVARISSLVSRQTNESRATSDESRATSPWSRATFFIIEGGQHD